MKNEFCSQFIFTKKAFETNKNHLFFMNSFRLLKREDRGGVISDCSIFFLTSSLSGDQKKIWQKRWKTPPIVSAVAESMKILFILALLTSILLLPIFSGATEIRYEMNDFHIEVTQNVSHETFVIDEDASSGQLPNDLKQLIADCRLPVVHFKLGSSVLDSSEGDIMLAALKQHGVTSNAHLIITGYACELGPDQYNQTLSLQRAETVASILQAHGFSVKTVQGKGSQNPITSNPQEFHWNRRVEIEIAR